MATYPPVTAAERDAAIARIARRHLSVDDTRWSEAEPDSDTAARDVLSYLRRRHSTLPYAVAAADVWDELVLNAWLYWDERRRERDLLRRAQRYGLTAGELGSFLGIGTRQGARDYLDRLDALLAENSRYTRGTDPASSILAGEQSAQDERTTAPRAPHVAASFIGRPRSSRGADVHTWRERRAVTRTRPSRERWLNQHAPRIESVISDLLRQASRVGLLPAPGDSADFDLDNNASNEDDLADYLYWLSTSLSGGTEGSEPRFSPATLGSLGLALGELRTHPEVISLPRNHGLRLALTSADRLRADYAALKADT